MRREISDIFDVKLSVRRIQYYRHKMGYNMRRLRRAPLLSDRHKFERLKWCLENRDNDFENYVFVDETKIEINQTPIAHLRKKTSNPICMIENNFQRLTVNIWAGISFLGATQIVVS